MSKIKTASFLGFVAILTGLLNYITHPILIRYLSEGDYVQVGVYVSIIAILSIPASGFGSLMLELFHSDKSELFTSKNFQKELWKYSFFYGIFSIFGVFLGIFFLRTLLLRPRLQLTRKIILRILLLERAFVIRSMEQAQSSLSRKILVISHFLGWESKK